MKGYVLSFKGERGPEVFAACGRLGFWPAGKTWWFAWHELEIRLPALLVDPESVFDARWDAARIFAGAAELRWERQGRERVVRLLVEDEARRRLPDGLVQAATELSFTAEEGRRLLVSGRLNLPGGTFWGRVEFPRALDYGVDGGDLGCCLAARVYLYRSEDGALRLVRYADLVTVADDRRTHDSWRVRPFGEGETQGRTGKERE